MKLRDWQEKAFPLWWLKKRGIIKVVTGSGKTFFDIHCLKKYLEESPKKSILIVVPSIALLDQWYEGLSQQFNDKEISLNGGGEQAEEGGVRSGRRLPRYIENSSQLRVQQARPIRLWR